MKRSFALSCLLAIAAGTAGAATQGDPSFTAEVAFGAPGNLPESATGIAQSVDGSCDAFSETGCDILIPKATGATGIGFTSPTAFDIGLSGGNSNGLGQATDVFVTLSDLDFQESGAPVPITGVEFDIDANSFSDFLQSEDNPSGDAVFRGVDISFLDTSITLAIRNFSNQLFADGPSLGFTIETGSADSGPVPAVPLPAGGLLLLAALGGLGVVRKRRVT